MAKTDLSRRAIVERALEIADDEGIDAVTVRRLAQDFGVTPMALYWHVSNKDELLAAMGDRFFEDLPAVPDEGDWPTQLRALVGALVDSMRAHPGAAQLAPARVLACDPGRELTERVLGLLRSAGFGVAEAANLAGSALQIATTLVLGQAGAERGVPEEERDAARAAKREAIAALPRSRYPHLVDAADAFSSCADEKAYYDFGIDLFMAGAERMALRLAAVRE